MGSAPRLAALCAQAGIPLIQISTDYVHDGQKGTPYVEDDLPNPLSAYGRSKLAGEWAALSGNPMTAVLRTAWVFSAVGKNFLRTMLAVGALRPELRVVADQYGHPTAAPDLADAIAGILARIRATGWRADYRGVFQAVADGHTSWHGFAEAIFAAAKPFGGPSPMVHPIATGDYPTQAPRPADGRLALGKLQATFDVALPPWRDGPARVMRDLHARG